MSDTHLLSAPSRRGDCRYGNRSDSTGRHWQIADLVVYRFLGSRAARRWLRAAAELWSTAGRDQRRAVAGRRFDRALGGCGRGARLPCLRRPANLPQLHPFLSDTVLLTGVGLNASRATDTGSARLRAPFDRLKAATQAYPSCRDLAASVGRISESTWPGTVEYQFCSIRISRHVIGLAIDPYSFSPSGSDKTVKLGS
jgi:hypothetical protein